METLELAGIITIIAALVWLVIGIIWLIRNGKKPDEAATTRINEVAANPAVIHEMRLAYQGASEIQRDALDFAYDVLKMVAPLTPTIKADDAARDLLDKINDPPTQPAKS